MKNFFKFIAMALIFATFGAGCTEVDNGYKGVVYKPYSGGLNPDQIYPEGVDIGISWLWNDMITYDCRQHTTDLQMQLLDKDQMEVPISISVFHRVNPTKIGHLHLDKGHDYVETYIVPVTEGAVKNVVGSYTAQELVTSKREIAEAKIKEILVEDFAVNYLQVDNIIIKDINLPEKVAKAIVLKKEQDEKNLLAEKLKAEKDFLAAAKLSEATGNYNAAVFDAKTKDIMSQPKMLELLKLENDGKLIDKWCGNFGNNNVFQEVPMIRMPSQN